MTQSIDVVILTWNDQADMVAAVQSVLASTGCEPTVIVVDNGSDPPAQVPDDHRVRLVRNDENRGVPAGRNQGAALGAAPFVATLDSDAVVEPTTLQRLLEPMLADPSIGATCPVFVGHAPEHTAGRHPSILRKVARGLNLTDRYASMRPASGDGAASSSWDVEFAIGACQVIRRSVFDTMGGFQEGHLFGPEDIEFSTRLRHHGYRLVQVAGVGCHHVARRSHKRLLSRQGLRHVVAVGRYYANGRTRA